MGLSETLVTRPVSAAMNGSGENVAPARANLDDAAILVKNLTLLSPRYVAACHSWHARQAHLQLRILGMHQQSPIRQPCNINIYNTQPQSPIPSGPGSSHQKLHHTC
jgi:hypothetical protein